MKNNNYSPLRYPGGKGRLIDFIKSVIEKNDLKGGTYIEPFSGGAAIALALAIDGYMNMIVPYMHSGIQCYTEQRGS